MRKRLWEAYQVNVHCVRRLAKRMSLKIDKKIDIFCCDGSEGKPMDSGIQGPWFKPRQRPEQVKTFPLVYKLLLWNLMYLTQSICLIAINTCDNK